MKKFASFALVVCLLVLAVAIVLGVTYPNVQKNINDFFSNLWEGTLDFFDRLIEVFRGY